MQQEHKDIYNAVWQFFKKHVDSINSSDEFWNTVHDEAVELGNKFNNHPLLKSLLIAVWDEFARILEESKEEESKPP